MTFISVIILSIKVQGNGQDRQRPPGEWGRVRAMVYMFNGSAPPRVPGPGIFCRIAAPAPGSGAGYARRVCMSKGTAPPRVPGPGIFYTSASAIPGKWGRVRANGIHDQRKRIAARARARLSKT